MIRQLAHTCLFTDRLDDMRRFYVEALGLAVAHTFVNPATGERFGLYLGAGNHTFVELFDRAGAQRMWGGDDARVERGTGFRHLCFEVAGLDDMRAQLRRGGVEVTAPTREPDGQREAWTADPDGNPVELLEYPPEIAARRGA